MRCLFSFLNIEHLFSKQMLLHLFYNPVLVNSPVKFLLKKKNIYLQKTSKSK